jgi:hypothetical protein
MLPREYLFDKMHKILRRVLTSSTQGHKLLNVSRSLGADFLK